MSPEDKKKRAERIAELKKRTCCNKCGKKGHWANECPDNKRESSPEKSKKAASAQKAESKSEANAVAGEDGEDSSTVFMAYSGEKDEPEDAWYLDGGATDHMTDKIE